jgi:hypothetical protein
MACLDEIYIYLLKWFLAAGHCVEGLLNLYLFEFGVKFETGWLSIMSPGGGVSLKTRCQNLVLLYLHTMLFFL